VVRAIDGKNKGLPEGSPLVIAKDNRWALEAWPLGAALGYDCHLGAALADDVGSLRGNRRGAGSVGLLGGLKGADQTLFLN